MKSKNFIDQSIMTPAYNFFTRIDHHVGKNIWRPVYYFLLATEFASYGVASIILCIAFYLMIKYMIIFYRKKDHPVSDLLKMKLLMGNVLAVCLTLILVGHVIRLIFSSNVYILFFILMITGIRELIVYLITKENNENLYKYYQHMEFEKKNKKQKK